MVCGTAQATPCLLKSDNELFNTYLQCRQVCPIQAIPPKCFPKHLPWAWSHPFLEPPCRHDSSLPDPQVGCACGLSHRPPQCPPRSHHNTGTAGETLCCHISACCCLQGGVGGETFLPSCQGVSGRRHPQNCSGGRCTQLFNCASYISQTVLIAALSCP